MLPRAVRIKFIKIGNLQFISHLDLCRTMKTAFIRAKLPIYYSEGFNPHPKMVFAMPLSIGAESICELLDIKVTEDISNGEILARFNAVLPDEMKILDVYDPETKFTDILWAKYDICYTDDADTSPLDQSEIFIMKRTKSGDKECDIKPQIKSWSKIDGGISAVLSAESASYLNPEYLAKILRLSDYTIMRRAMLCGDGESVFR